MGSVIFSTDDTILWSPAELYMDIIIEGKPEI